MMIYLLTFELFFFYLRVSPRFVRNSSIDVFEECIIKTVVTEANNKNTIMLVFLIKSICSIKGNIACNPGL